MAIQSMKKTSKNSRSTEALSVFARPLAIGAYYVSRLVFNAASRPGSDKKGRGGIFSIPAPEWRLLKAVIASVAKQSR